MSLLAKVVLTGTAFAPIIGVYSILEIINKAYWCAAFLGIICVILGLILVLIFHHALETFERSRFSIETVEASDRESVGFLLMYLLPVLRTTGSEFQWVTLGIVILVFTLIMATGYNYHFNPILRLRGWHFYKVGTNEGVTYVLITKKQLRNAAEDVTAIQLTEYVIVDIGEKQ